LHLAFRSVPEAGPFQFQLSVCQFDTSRLRAVVPNVAAGLAWCARPGDLFGAQCQDLFHSLVSDLMDHGLYYLAGVLDQVQDGKQDLSIGSTELLDDSTRFVRGPRHDIGH
jgi:hypothetical protein